MSVLDILGTVIRGLPNTLIVTACALLLGSTVALPLTAMSTSRSRVVAVPVRLFVDVVRGVPPIVWIFLLYYGLAKDVVQLLPTPAAIGGLGIISSAYMTEVYRSGLLAVDRGQWEAAYSAGMSTRQVLVYVIGPQAIRTVIPPGATFALNLLKDSSIASLIGVHELTYYANTEAARSFHSLTIYVIAALLYVIAGLPLAYFSRSIDQRLRVGLVT